ncbi:MAG: LD-carboxypeptidase [Sandaracinaceae bacterium]
MQPVPALTPGAHVRVVAPASPFPTDEFERGLARLEARYRVSLGASVRMKDGYLAGSDEARAADVLDALDDPSVRAIVAARGGYGVTRLLDRIPVERVRPTLLVGFSDLTALHALFARAGLRSLHASMLTGLGRGSDAELEAWYRVAEGLDVPGFDGLETIADGRAEGPVVGGNLALLCALIGTPFAPPIDGAILFLEDVNEAPYRIDRMLTQLGHAGWLGRVRGIAIGELTRCDAGPDGREVSHVLRDRLGALGVPVVSGLAVGHGEVNRPLPLGARARIDASRGRLEYLESPVTAPS